jgi:hypothetical protein
MGAKGWGRYGVRSNVESLFLVGDQSLVKRSHIFRPLAKGQRMAEQECKLSGLDQPSNIHCPVTPVCVLQAVASVKEEHMHSIALEQERP